MAKETIQTVNQNTIPAQLMPYATSLMGQAQSLTNYNPYQAYQGQQVAGYNPLQQQAFQNIYQQQTPAELNQAMGMAGLAGLEATNKAYMPYQAATAEDMGAYMYRPEDVNVMDYNQQNINAFMSPYTEDVIKQQRLGAIEDYADQLPQLASATSQVGGLGGSRQALLQSQKSRELRSRLADIRSSGLQSAFQNAQQAFGQQQQARYQAAAQNQQSAYNTRLQNLQAAMQAKQAAEQSRQFGAGQGAQNIQARLQAAQTLGGLSQQQFQNQQAINQGLLSAGQQLGAPQQQQLTADYQNFQQAVKYPYQQLGFMSDILRGVPTYQSASTTTQPAPSGIASLLTAGASAAQMV
jgi:hypothetical protein